MNQHLPLMAKLLYTSALLPLVAMIVFACGERFFGAAVGEKLFSLITYTFLPAVVMLMVFVWCQS